MKKLLSIILCVLMLSSFSALAFADTADNSEEASVSVSTTSDKGTITDEDAAEAEQENNDNTEGKQPVIEPTPSKFKLFLFKVEYYIETFFGTIKNFFVNIINYFK